MQSKCEENSTNDKVVDTESVNMGSICSALFWVLAVTRSFMNAHFPSASFFCEVTDMFIMCFTPTPSRSITKSLSCGNRSVKCHSCSLSFERRKKAIFSWYVLQCAQFCISNSESESGQQVVHKGHNWERWRNALQMLGYGQQWWENPTREK